MKLVRERGTDHERVTPRMSDDLATLNVDYHAVVAEDTPSRPRERVSERRLAGAAIAGEHPCATVRIDHRRRMHEIASALP